MRECSHTHPAVPRLPQNRRWSLRTCCCSVERQRKPHSTTKTSFIGSDVPGAGEYHDNDFSYEEHRRIVQESRADLERDRPETANLAEEPSVSYQSDQALDSWENFHARDNGTARFYKERRYLLLEFPALGVQTPPQHFIEIGCGAGSSLLPVLKANPSCQATGTDLSTIAISMFRQKAQSAGISADRFNAFSCDSAASEAGLLADLNGDAVLLIFTLAALPPSAMPAMLHNVFQALRPGGLVLLRDHGLYDLTHLRLREDQRVGPRLYRRQDGTLCYFFTIEKLTELMKGAGFKAVECKYACVSLRNRKRSLTMRRVFVHGVFKKPG